MTKISCVIVDDEPPAIKLIEKYCSMIEQLEVQTTCQSAIEAFGLLKHTQVDLLFLDIQMPVLNGIDFLKTLQKPPAVIITTAYREFAVEGYDLDIIDYLLKPISFERFLKAVDRYRQKQIAPTTTALTNEKDEFVFFNINKKHHKVIIANIIYLESLKDYTKIHTSKEQLIVKGNLGTTLKQLPEDKFIRIHRSFALSLSYLKSYNQKIVELEATTLPIGESYREAFLKRLQK